METVMQEEYYHHPSFVKELEDFIAAHCNSTSSATQTISDTQRLLKIHFQGTYGPQVSKKHLGQAEGFGAYNVYWLHLQIPNSGLSRTQQPKAYFYRGEKLSFLCLGSHVDNYKDDKLRKLAKQRLNEILEIHQSSKS